MDWDAEYKKCLEDPHHFFTTYWMVDGKPATTHMTKEQFNDFFKLKQMVENPPRHRLFQERGATFTKSELEFYKSN